MNTVTQWLATLGLSEYAQLFDDNAINWGVLPQLNHELLKEIGVKAVGHRLLLLEAIGKIEPNLENQSNTGQIAIQSRPTGDAERRQLTVMFCDLIGSTSMSTKLDPEDLREVIVAYQNAAAAKITEFGGHVAKFMGDGVLAYFGWPLAHENDAERAVRAGLDLVKVVSCQKAPNQIPLACRVGIATGQVVVGDIIGDGAAQEEAVVGETPNLAARLEGIAESGQVVVSASTRQLLGELFHVSELGNHKLKGFDQPVPVWCALGVRRLESRFEGRSGDTTPIIGRNRETGFLQDLWARNNAGEGHVVLLSGEAGIGKSRLCAELRTIASPDHHAGFNYQCSPFHQDSPLYPVIQHLERTANLQTEDTDETKLDKLERLIEPITKTSMKSAFLLAQLLSISTGDRYPAYEMSPQMRKDLILQAVIDQIIVSSGPQPVLMIFEDLHWIDPTSLELIDKLVEIASTFPILLILTFRPEFKPPWVGQDRVESIVLNRLNTGAGASLIKRITGDRPLPKTLEEQILVKTDGVPLFVEELTKTIVESGLLEIKNGVYHLVRELPNLKIPETLQDSLMARLDKLGPVKEVAQTGAVVGREFSYELIAAISDFDTQELTNALGQLADAELIYARGHPPVAIYLFKHALVQDAAYNSLLHSRRQQLHKRVVRAFEEDFLQYVEHEPELVAYHAEKAGLTEKAIGYLHRAAVRINIGTANAEAEGHIRKALLLLDALPDDIRPQTKAKLMVLLGRILTAKWGYGHAEVKLVYSEVEELLEKTEDSTLLFPVLLSLTVYSVVRADLAIASTLCKRLIDLAAAKRDPILTVEAHYAAGVTLSWQGEFSQARYHFELACDQYRIEQHDQHLALYGQDGGPVCYCRHAMVLWYLGYTDQARFWIEKALSLTDQLGHPLSRNNILNWATWLYSHLRDYNEAKSWNQKTLNYAEEHVFPFWAAMAVMQRGWLEANQGQVEQGIESMNRGIERCKQLGIEMSQAYNLALLGEVLGKNGNLAEGILMIERGLQKTANSKSNWCLPELLRIRGDLAVVASPDQPGNAESWYQKAIHEARRASAKSWELRATTSLARIWLEQGQHQRARNLLKPVVDWFEEGHDTPDFKDAESLLHRVI